MNILTIFRNYIRSKGAKFLREDNSSTEFERNGVKYIFICDKFDPHYFRIVLCTGLKVNDENKYEILELINYIIQKFKAAKSAIGEDNNVWVSVESFVYSMDNIDELFDRALTQSDNVLEEYKEYLKKVTAIVPKWQ